MISKKNILSTLNDLNKKYNDSMRSSIGNAQDPIRFSKWALLEYGGWLEEIFDAIARRSVKGKIKTTVFEDILNNDVIQKTYGFQYDQHFRPMLIKSIGLQKMERIENELLKNGDLTILKNELQKMKKPRDIAAHTSVGITSNYDAPSITIGSFNKTYPILKKLYAKVSKI